MKSFRAVLLGIFAAVAVIFLVESISHWLYPMPAGIKPNDKDAMMDWISTLPVSAMLIVLLAWLLGAAAGAYVANYLNAVNGLRSAMIVGLFLLVATIMNLYQIPHPFWMWPAGIGSIIIGCYAGMKLASFQLAKKEMMKSESGN
jgi:hypothetical protein